MIIMQMFIVPSTQHLTWARLSMRWHSHSAAVRVEPGKENCFFHSSKANKKEILPGDQAVKVFHHHSDRLLVQNWHIRVVLYA